MDYNCQLWRMGMIHVRVAFCTRKERQAAGWRNYSFYLSKLNLTCPILSTECVGSGRTNIHVFFR